MKYTKEEYIEKANKIHNHKYDYSLADYKGTSKYIKIICPIHGLFEQNAGSHLNGSGCPMCAGLKKRTTDEYITKCKEVHGDRYDYSKTVYVNKRSPVIIGCKIHGFFTQNANKHLRGQGCPECGKKYASEWRKNNYIHFINESKKRFGDTFEFPDIENLYENSHSIIRIKCKKCGSIFNKIACDHLTSNNGGCFTCNAKTSYSENEIYDYICELIGKENVVLHDRNILNGREIDIYIPSLKLGFEYNGIFWHSEKFKYDKNYHLEKTEECKLKGVKLVQIFEDEYINHKEIVLSKIKHLLNKCNSYKIYGRKCKISEVNKNEAKIFLDKNHIQGFASSTVYLGCFYNNLLVAVMSFIKRGNEWELNRFATDINYICCGIGGKLFNYFKNNYNPLIIKSFADRRWTTNEDNNLYIKLGFKFEKFIYPDYRYVNGKDIKRFHKFGFRKKILNEKYGLSMDLTEKEMANQLNLNKIWDCGLIKYIWKNE